MTTPIAVTASPPRRLGRSTLAVFVGFIAVVVLSSVTDQVLHVLGVYPPWSQPLYDPGLNLLALAYRGIYSGLGGYIAARLAPYAPVRHAKILAVVGLVAGAIGVIVAFAVPIPGPKWYPILVAVTGPPLSWLGGIVFERRHHS